MSTRYDQMRDECQAFHNAHPEVWQEFVALAFMAVDRGYKSYGVATIWEVMRWNRSLESPDDDTFKVNNNFRAFYARRFHSMYPEQQGFFHLREQKSKEGPAVNLPPLTPADFPAEQVQML